MGLVAIVVWIIAFAIGSTGIFDMICLWVSGAIVVVNALNVVVKTKSIGSLRGIRSVSVTTFIFAVISVGVIVATICKTVMLFS